MKLRSGWFIVAFFLLLLTSAGYSQNDAAPRSLDDRLVVELFAEHPQIVTPTGIAVDQQGRVFVAESHTHFRPDDYDGPKGDRILILQDTDGDGRADKRQVFHEGFTHVMDIEFHHDGSLYVATRMDIHRMRDTDGDDVADEITPIVKMETTGTYPHNGLSGLAFEFDGSFHFGLGENLGRDYTLVGSDGERISGGGEGGSTYHVQADGSKLRRISTGWWNPFGMCVDAFGRVFGTDNDPGASPPCRLIQVFEGGDYGYEYRYGRTGLHPLISWTGDMPGTIPMIAGTGEAPCAIVAYEGASLPAEYRGQLLVASWADHRIERYPLKRSDRLAVETSRHVLVEGRDDFRPVGLAIAPDGSIYVSDWVSSSYTLHKKGRIWRIRPKKFPPAVEYASLKQQIESLDRKVREPAARRALQNEEGRQTLRDLARHSKGARVRVMAVDALASIRDKKLDAWTLMKEESSVSARWAMLRHRFWRQAVIASAPSDDDLFFVWHHELLRSAELDWGDLDLDVLNNPDPVLFTWAVDALARGHSRSKAGFFPENPVAAILAHQRDSKAYRRLSEPKLEEYLSCKNKAARFLAVKWIADDKLVDYRGHLEKMLREQQDLDVTLFLAVSAALDRLDGQKPNDVPPPARLLKMIEDDDAALPVRRIALRLLDPTFTGLKTEFLTNLLTHKDVKLRLEAVRTLAGHGSPERVDRFVELASDEDQPVEVRAAAILALAPVADEQVRPLLTLANGPEAPLRNEALRSLVGVELRADDRQQLRKLAEKRPELAEAVRRIVAEPKFDRPAVDNVDGWLEMIGDEGDAEAGERIFFGTKVGTCSKCHQFDGRGQAVGPPLTFISRRLDQSSPDESKRWLLETILQPSKQMAPQYTPWQIVTKDGQVLTGLPRRKGGSSEAYLGLDGKEFSVKKGDIDFHRESKTSIMPADLLNGLTRRELNDLFAFLLE